MPIIFYAVTAKESYAGLEKILTEKVVNPLNRIEGVGSVNLAGVPGRKVYIDVDPQKMEAYNLTIEQIGNDLWLHPKPAECDDMGRWLENFYASSDPLPEDILADR